MKEVEKSAMTICSHLLQPLEVLMKTLVIALLVLAVAVPGWSYEHVVLVEDFSNYT